MKCIDLGRNTVNIIYFDRIRFRVEVLQVHNKIQAPEAFSEMKFWPADVSIPANES